MYVSIVTMRLAVCKYHYQLYPLVLLFFVIMLDFLWNECILILSITVGLLSNTNVSDIKSLTKVTDRH